LIKLVLARQIFEKYSNIKFHEHPFFGSPVVPCGRTDRQTDKNEAHSRFSQFGERASEEWHHYAAEVFDSVLRSESFVSYAVRHVRSVCIQLWDGGENLANRVIHRCFADRASQYTFSN